MQTYTGCENSLFRAWMTSYTLFLNDWSVLSTRRNAIVSVMCDFRLENVGSRHRVNHIVHQSDPFLYKENLCPVIVPCMTLAHKDMYVLNYHGMPFFFISMSHYKQRCIWFIGTETTCDYVVLWSQSLVTTIHYPTNLCLRVFGLMTKLHWH